MTWAHIWLFRIYFTPSPALKRGWSVSGPQCSNNLSAFVHFFNFIWILLFWFLVWIFRLNFAFDFNLRMDDSFLSIQILSGNQPLATAQSSSWFPACHPSVWYVRLVNLPNAYYGKNHIPPDGFIAMPVGWGAYFGCCIGRCKRTAKHWTCGSPTVRNLKTLFLRVGMQF